VREATGLPTVIENDVIALTGAEHWFGESRTLARFAVITIGTGVGYGLVIHDRVVTTPDVGVGLLGHHPLEPAGPLCPAGHRGCAEAMLSIPGIEAEASVAYRRPVPYADVLQLAETGDPLALKIVRQSARALGRLVAAVANITMAEHIVVTGEGVDLARVGRDALAEGVCTDRDPAASPVDVRIKPDDIDEWARGAAAIAIQHHVLDGMRADTGAQRSNGTEWPPRT
jgi:predicted NBD/HSP70 family sugar kinase